MIITIGRNTRLKYVDEIHVDYCDRLKYKVKFDREIHVDNYDKRGIETHTLIMVIGRNTRFSYEC